jgi:hypothetical protein
MEFDTKIAVVICDDLELWQKLNVTAFLTSGIVSSVTGLIGEPSEDAGQQRYLPLIIQPMIIFASDAAALHRTRARAISRGVPLAVYIEDMFSSGHDGANRKTVLRYNGDELALVGLSMRGERKV